MVRGLNTKTLLLLGIIIGSLFVICGCTEEQQYTSLPVQGIGELEIKSYGAYTHWQEGIDEESFERKSRPGFIHELPNQTNPHTISFWIECELYNQYDQDISPITIGLTFLNRDIEEVYQKEVTFDEGLSPGETKWFTVVTNKEKEEFNNDIDFTEIKGVNVVAYTES